jgi:hypothetical protein
VVAVVELDNAVVIKDGQEAVAAMLENLLKV